MKAPGLLDILYYHSALGTIKFQFRLKDKYLGESFVKYLGESYFNLEFKKWHYFKIERRSTGHPDNKCSTTVHVNFNQIMEKITDCGSYSATETELYASCVDCCPYCKSVSGLVDSMRFVWL